MNVGHLLVKFSVSCTERLIYITLNILIGFFFLLAGKCQTGSRKQKSLVEHRLSIQYVTEFVVSDGSMFMDSVLSFG
jgi:hypothetical protein